MESSGTEGVFHADEQFVAIQSINNCEDGATYSELEDACPENRSTISKFFDRREEYGAVQQGTKLGYKLEIVCQSGPMAARPTAD